MTQHLPRFHAHHQHIRDQQKLARILLETGEHIATVTKATLPGDTRRLRGIPVQARGVGGTSPNTDPYQWAEARDPNRDKISA